MVQSAAPISPFLALSMRHPHILVSTIVLLPLRDQFSREGMAGQGRVILAASCGWKIDIAESPLRVGERPTDQLGLAARELELESSICSKIDQKGICTWMETTAEAPVRGVLDSLARRAMW